MWNLIFIVLVNGIAQPPQNLGRFESEAACHDIGRRIGAAGRFSYTYLCVTDNGRY
jgi:hypothetical protein